MKNEKNDLTAGEFQTMTGLTAKALRLYAERGILTPASVDPSSGYRRYARSQLQHGMTTDLLRRAQVPLSELVSAISFPFDQWRETVEMRRQLEDFYLAVAEHVTTFDPADFTAHTSEAPALDWVGVVIDLDVPEDIEGRIETFTGLAVETPAVGKAFGEALTDLGVGPTDVCWTAVPDTATRSGGGQLLLARPSPVHLGEADREHIAGRVRSSTGQSVVPVTATLPPRVEITFTARSHRRSDTGRGCRRRISARPRLRGLRRTTPAHLPSCLPHGRSSTRRRGSRSTLSTNQSASSTSSHPPLMPDGLTPFSHPAA